MDPLNAVGLAAGILQFVEFTAKLVNDGRQIYHSAQGATLENCDLEAVTQSLVVLTEGISRYHTRYDSKGRLQNSASDIDAPTEQSINKLGTSCQDIAKELLDALEQLKAPNNRSRWESIVEALKTVWARSKIQELRHRLDQYRVAIHTALLVSTRIDMSNMTADIKKLRRKDEMGILKAEVLEAVQRCRTESIPGNYGGYAHIMRSLEKMTAKEKDLSMQARLLQQLSFQDQPEREHRIVKAHAKTFRWIWTDPTGQLNKPWSHFPAWLEGNDDKLYWMTGKAGSGKSTLMKYVVHQERCDESLRRWSGQMPLIVTRFYLWNSGSEHQMSQEGLIRAILHDALSQHPELIPKVLSKRWQRYQLFGSDVRVWKTSELEESFEALAKSAEGSFKLCLFVDGLDEFNGEHDLLIRLFRMAISFPNVKACLSSRPWPIFEEAFEQEPSLRLEDITYPDIIKYITDHLTANTGYAALRRKEPGFSSTLIENIAKKSSEIVFPTFN
ncbi:hypothetical protein CKAH01_18028 [Colletotrichum kahawae]|uniref:NACHT domain-containing protein n=1 Tax=Colletotrichum kahawae TaxID=34407 RepID=A0AAD9Y9N2_COLKA|nr:hypothetical protein CKAH01_18028 [Colletotrichum kahawae]